MICRILVVWCCCTAGGSCGRVASTWLLVCEVVWCWELVGGVAVAG